MNPRPTYYKCPGCERMHHAKDDHARGGVAEPQITRMQLDVLHGHGGWNEIRPDEVAAWRAGVPHQRERNHMNDLTSVKIYGGPKSDYDMVWFEGPCLWFIRSTERATGAQAYSSMGYDSKHETMQAFEGTITYVDQPPGQS